MAVLVNISGQNINTSTLYVLASSMSLHDALDQRSTCTFAVYDKTGTHHYQPGQPVTVTDTFAVSPLNPTGLIFTGYINDSSELELVPNPDIVSTISCIDQHYLADKRVSQTDYTGWFAGDIVSDLLARYLSQEGVLATYALRRDSTASDFTQGTLSNTIGSLNVGDGNLELAPAGSTVSIAENTSTSFLQGTLVGTYGGLNNSLTLFGTPTIKLSGTSEAAGQGQGASSSSVTSTTDNYCYMEVWNSTLAGSSPTIASGDTLRFFIFIPSTNPQCVGGVDVLFDNGEALFQVSPAITDQQGLPSHPGTDLSGYANDQHYKRVFALDQSGSSQVGRSIKSVRVAIKGDQPGDYIVYVDTIQLFNGSNAVKTTFFNGTLQTTTFAMLSGFANVSCSVVTSYVPIGTRVSPSYSIANAAIAKTSLISWQSQLLTSTTGTTMPLAVGATGLNSVPYVQVESSLDGGVTWQVCTNHGPVPGLLAGMNLVGTSVMLRQTLSLAGTDPTITPELVSVVVTVQPSYQYTKTDAKSVTGTQAKWNAGTISTSGGNSTLVAQSNNDLTLNGKFSNWANADKSNQTLLGTGSDSIIAGSYVLTNSGANVEAHTQLSWAGTWGAHDFVLECDVFIDQYGNYGLVYMTSNWNTNNNTWGYEVDFSLISSVYTLTFARGSNSGSTGTQTNITQVAVPVSGNQWHRLRVAYTQSTTTHNIYVDDVLYITSANNAITGAGGVGVRYFNTGVSVGGSTQHSAYFANFGVVAAMSGTWTSPSTSLNSVVTAGKSLIQWYASVPVNALLQIYSSLDGGSTWQSCTNGTALPTPLPGTSLVGKNLKLKAQLTSNNANATVALHGLSVWVLGQYSASGSRVGIPLNLSNVGKAGATLVSWNGTVSANTTINIDTSLDGNNWTNVGGGSQGSAPIAGIVAQIDPVEDTFTKLSSSFYTSISQGGGQNASWTWDTTNSRVTVSGGNNAFLLYSGLIAQDIDLLADMDEADSSGLVWRQVDSRNFYDVMVQDASSPSPNQIVLNKVTGGVRTQLASASITLARDTPHRLRVTMFGNVITIYFDGIQMLTYTDLHPLGAGLTGLCNDSISGHGTGRFYRFRVQPQGDSVVGKTVFTRVRMTSTDPSVTPQLSDITTSVHGPNIQNGAFIPSTTYSVLNGSTNTIASDLDDMAKQSNYWWRIFNFQLYFQARNAILSPWIVTGDEIKRGQGAIQVDTISDLYRNSSWILGGTDTQIVSQTFIADGITQSWNMDYPVDSLQSVTVDNNVATFGIQGVDTNKQIYYTVGNNTVTQDITQVPYLNGQKLVFQYNARTNVAVNAQDASLIAARSVIDGTSGIIEVAETASGLNRDAATQLAQSRIVQYGVNGQTLQFPVIRSGLGVGQLVSVFLPEHGITDGEYLIVGCDTKWITVNQHGKAVDQPVYTLSMTSGPLTASWMTYQAGLHK